MGLDGLILKLILAPRCEVYLRLCSVTGGHNCGLFEKFIRYCFIATEFGHSRRNSAAKRLFSC